MTRARGTLPLSAAQYQYCQRLLFVPLYYEDPLFQTACKVFEEQWRDVRAALVTGPSMSFTRWSLLRIWRENGGIASSREREYAAAVFTFLSRWGLDRFDYLGYRVAKVDPEGWQAPGADDFTLRGDFDDKIESDGTGGYHIDMRQALSAEAEDLRRQKGQASFHSPRGGWIIAEGWTVPDQWALLKSKAPETHARIERQGGFESLSPDLTTIWPVHIALCDGWKWRTESPTEAKHRLYQACKAEIDRQIGRATQQTRNHAHVYPDTAGKRPLFMLWLYRRLAYREGCRNIADAENDRRRRELGEEASAKKIIGESTVRERTNALAKELGISGLPHAQASYSPDRF